MMARRRNDPRDTEALLQRLEEAESTLRAIREGTVDAFLVEQDGEQRVYTLASADRPYRVLIESMQQGAVTVLEDQTVLYANARALDMLGDPGLIGRVLGATLSEEDRREIDRLIRESDGRSCQGELCIRLEGRPEMPVHVGVSRLPADGPPSWSIILTDLTDQKEREALERRQLAMEENDRRKDEFLATLAHELRNPLAPLRTGLQVMEMATRDTEAFYQARDIMRRQLYQMVRLVDGLMDVSRLTLGKMELNREPTDLNEIVRRAAETVRADYGDSSQELEVRPSPVPLTVSADPARLQQVFTNVLDNAHRYTQRGGRVVVTVGEDEAHAVIRVRDNGRGIDAADLPRVFELFVHGGTDGGPPEGLGVGLSIAQRLVRMHGGSITATSEGENRGTEITVRLPLVDSSPIVSGEHATARRLPGRRSDESRKCRVLVADDNVASTRSLSLMLTMAGHDVKAALDGHEAYDVAEWVRPEVAVLDIGMPRLNGLELCRRIRAQSWGKKMLLIAVTAWGQPSHIKASMEAGFDHHLVKPVDPAELLALIGTPRAQRL